MLLCGPLTKPDSQGDPSAKIIQPLLVPFLPFILLYERFNPLTPGRISYYRCRQNNPGCLRSLGCIAFIFVRLTPGVGRRPRGKVVRCRTGVRTAPPGVRS